MHAINRKSRLIETYSLILIDLLCVVLAYATALVLRFKDLKIALSNPLHFMVGFYLMLLCVLYGVMLDWNRGFFRRGYLREAVAIGKYDFVMMIAIVVILYLTKQGGLYSRLTFGFFTIANFVYTYILHSFFKWVMLNYYRKSANADQLMIVTEKECAEDIVKKIKEYRDWNYRISAIAIMDEDMTGEKIDNVPVVCSKEHLFDVSRQMPLDQVFMYLPHARVEEIRECIVDFETMGVVVHYNVEISELNLEGKTAGSFADYSVMTFSLQYLDYRRILIKRLMDIIGGLIGSIVTILLTPFLAFAIKIESKGPVFFSQIRIGKNGRRFKIYKFRSMYSDAEQRKKELARQNEMGDSLMFKMEHDPRITHVGHFIRKTSLDEFPQFFNVLKGDMSLVGTRPPTEDEFEQYNNYYRRRMSITPGLTGMWQVKGRGVVTDFEDVVKYDLEYIDQWSLMLDVKLMFLTIGVVLFGKGAK
ncbi:MAG: sugar transferase [Lachnospiraceae bacterium]|nr:sugar transferase [Lachnospiraceae bacterium]